MIKNLCRLITYTLSNDSLFLDELYIYGTQRIGLLHEKKFMSTHTIKLPGLLNNFVTPALTPLPTLQPQPLTLYTKRYELTDWLGNVRVVITNKKTPLQSAPLRYKPDVVSVTDYYAFGSEVRERSYERLNYRYGFGTQEKDDEISGLSGTHYTAMFWEYDTRLGRRWNVDPVVKASNSTYSVNSNTPITNNDPNGDCDDCPKSESGFKLNYSLNGGGFNLSIYTGLSQRDNHVITGLNLTAKFIHGGAGTSKRSPNLFNIVMTPSLTFGSGNASNSPINLFTGMTGSGVMNTFKNSFTFGGNLVISTGINSNGSLRNQWLGAAAFRIGNFSMGSYNDTWKPPLFMGQSSDQFWSAGLNAQLMNGDNSINWSNDMYYGMSNQDARWSDDRIINNQNYDNQKLFDLLLNNGRENISFFNKTFGIVKSSTWSGFHTFYPSNKMHDTMRYADKPNGDVHSFHHLFVPYPNTEQRIIQFFEGNKP